MLELGDFLKFIRTKHGLTQSEMGDLFFRNKDYIYKIENNVIVPTIDELKLISKKLNEPIVMIVMYGLAVSQIFGVGKIDRKRI